MNGGITGVSWKWGSSVVKIGCGAHDGVSLIGCSGSTIECDFLGLNERKAGCDCGWRCDMVAIGERVCVGELVC